MQVQIDHDLLSADIAAVRDFFTRFLRSFGPSQKKIGDKPIGFFHEQYIRFRFMLVDMGPVKWFKSIIAIIGGLILYFTLFRHSDPLFAFVTIILFIFFYVWVWGEELGKEDKDGKLGFIEGWFLSIQKNIMGVFKKEEAPKKK